VFAVPAGRTYSPPQTLLIARFKWAARKATCRGEEGRGRKGRSCLSRSKKIPKGTNASVYY